MLRWTLLAIGALGGSVGLVALIGLVLPRNHRASKTATYTAPQEVVYAAIVDVRKYGEWRADVTQIEMLADDGGQTRFRESGGHGTITYRIEDAAPPDRVVFVIADPALPFGGSWVHELRSSADGATELTTTENGEVYNPIFRFMSRFIFSPTATIERYHAALARRVGPAEPSGRYQ